MSSTPESRLTFLFTDIEGSTKRWEEHPDAMRDALICHDTILRKTIEAHGGSVFKTVGDAFCATFGDAIDALQAAVAIQHAILAEHWEAVGTLRVRMALHTGQAEQRDNDYFGPTLNRVARLLAAGHGGQILLSASTQADVSATLPAGLALRDLGERQLRDLPRPEHIFQLLAPELPADFPPLRAIATQRSNLPVQVTSFIGREREIADVTSQLSAARLVTLTGAGGTGKTRLSLEVAAGLLERYPEGVWFIELAGLSDPTLVPLAVASTIGLREEPGRPVMAMLTDALRSRSALLILDNCEHLVAACAQLADALLQSCPQLRLLASSREALGIAGETLYAVPSLGTPEPQELPELEALAGYEAVRLFIERARQVVPSFALTPANARAVAQICRRLDGIPLALELAAARVKLLRVEQIERRLDDRFHLLTGGNRTALPRQQTLQALVGWSYDLLNEPERLCFERLAIFAGGWSLEAAETVCAGAGLAPQDVLELLSQLVNKSLVVVDSEQADETRYRFLETIRHFAYGRLAERGELAAFRQRHLSYFLALAERAEPELIGPAQGLWLRRMADEQDNIHASLDWAQEHDVEAGLRLASALGRFWEGQGYCTIGARRLGQLLEIPAAAIPDALRAKALSVRSYLFYRLADGNLTRAAAEESLSLFRRLGDRHGEAIALLLHGNAAFLQGDHVLGRQLAFKSLELSRQIGDRLATAEVLGMLGGFIDNQDVARAEAYLQESLQLFRGAGHLAGICSTLTHLAALCLREGQHERVRSYLEEVLALSRRLGRMDLALCLSLLGNLALRQGEYGQACAYYEESLTLNDRGGGGEWVLVNLAYARMRGGDLAGAVATFSESLRHFSELEWKIGMCYTLEGVASLAAARGRPELAARLFGWADVLRRDLDDRRPPVEQADVDRDLATLRSQLGEPAFAAAYAEGATLSLQQALELGRSYLG